MLNAIKLSGTVYSSSGTEADNPTRITDGDWSTYAGARVDNGDNYGRAGYAIYTFDSVKNIQQINYRLLAHSWSSSGASSNASSALVYIETSVNGTDWVELSGSRQSVSSNGDSNNTSDSGVVNLPVALNIKAIRVYYYITADKDCNPACGGSQSAEAQIFELEAMMPSSTFGQLI